MALSSSKQLGRISWVSLFALGVSAQAQDWMHHFRIGASVGMNIKTEFRTAGTFAVSGVNAGPATGQANHIYDNGYVKLDATGDAAPPGGQTQTTNFSYRDASQYDAGASTLSYQATSSFDATGTGSANDQPDLGFDMAYGGTIREWEHVAIGFEFGFNMNFLNPRETNPMAANMTIQHDQFSTAGIAPASFPAAGTAGNPSGAGTPALLDTPTRLAPTILPGTLAGSRGLDVTLYNFRLGPLLRWEFVPKWTLNGSAGGALTIMSGDYVFNEILTAPGTSTRNAGKFDATEFSYGGYAGAVLMYDTGNNWEPYLGAHYMLMQDINVASGGRSAKMNLGGAIYISAGINWSF